MKKLLNMSALTASLALLPMMTSTTRLNVVGISGTGKSTLVKMYLARELKRRASERWPWITFDPDDEYSVKGNPRGGEVMLGPLRDRVTFEEFQRDPARWLDQADLSLALVPSDDDDEAADQCADFVELLKHTGGIATAWDELGGFAFENVNASVSQKALNKLATKGRKWPAPLIYASQRLVHIPKSARAGLSALAAFLQTDKEDLRALDSITNDEEFSARVASHRAGECSIWLTPLLREGKAA